ncbi:hypothetical protein [Methanosarcina horonobensis]|uniref:hypothetical protein n=1 Tax=Methanosarcina horonobensis TaxID=418008 RepID=UPI000AB4B157|nr:hypothetical protein [Methanosarcina horonobensis]
MQKNIKWIAGSLLLSLVLIGGVFVGSADSNNPVITYAVEEVQPIEEKLPDYGPQIYEKN